MARCNCFGSGSGGATASMVNDPVAGVFTFNNGDGEIVNVDYCSGCGAAGSVGSLTPNGDGSITFDAGDGSAATMIDVCDLLAETNCEGTQSLVGDEHTGNTTTLDLVDANDDFNVRHVYLPDSGANTITLPNLSDGHPGIMTLQIDNPNGTSTVSFAGSNFALADNVDLSRQGQPTFFMNWDQVTATWQVSELGVSISDTLRNTAEHNAVGAVSIPREAADQATQLTVTATGSGWVDNLTDEFDRLTTTIVGSATSTESYILDLGQVLDVTGVPIEEVIIHPDTRIRLVRELIGGATVTTSYEVINAGSPATTGGILPGAPINFAFTGVFNDSGNPVFNWSTPIDAGTPAADSFSWRYRQQGDTAWTVFPVPTEPPEPTASIGIGAANPGETWEFQIRWENSNGAGPWSVTAAPTYPAVAAGFTFADSVSDYNNTQATRTIDTSTLTVGHMALAVVGDLAAGNAALPVGFNAFNPLNDTNSIDGRWGWKVLTAADIGPAALSYTGVSASIITIDGPTTAPFAVGPNSAAATTIDPAAVTLTQPGGIVVSTVIARDAGTFTAPGNTTSASTPDPTATRAPAIAYSEQANAGALDVTAWNHTATAALSDVLVWWDGVGGGGATPQAPSAPTALTAATATNTSVTLNWTAPVGGDAPTGYEYRVDGGAPVAVAGTTATVAGLVADTQYGFEVRATNAAGDSPWTAVVNHTITLDADDYKFLLNDLLTYPARPATLNTVLVNSEATLRNALFNAQPGDLIQLTQDIVCNQNTNWSTSGTAANPIVLDWNGFEITANNGRWMQLENPGSHWVFYEPRINGNSQAIWAFLIGKLAWQAGTANGGGGVGRSQNIKIYGGHIRNPLQETMKISFTDGIEVIGTEFSFPGRAPYDPTRYSRAAEMIYFGNGTEAAGFVTNVLIERCHFHDTTPGDGFMSGEAIDIKSPSTGFITVRRCLIEDIKISAAGAITILSTQNNIVGSTVLIEENVIRRTTTPGWTVDNNGVPTGNQADAITIGGGNCTVRCNVMHDITGNGIGLYENFLGDNNVTIENNTMWNVATDPNANRRSIQPLAGQAGQPPSNPANVIVNQNNITDDAFGQFQATAADFIGPLAGDSNAGDGPGTGYLLAQASAIPATAGALGKSTTPDP